MQTVQESKPEETTRSAATPSQYLTFRLADETYAVGILQAREILRYEELTTVPSTPDSIRGVLNLRGSVVPVVDLAVKFGLPKSAVTKWTCIIIVEAVLDGEETVMGILADSVSEVLYLTEDDVEPPPPFGTKVQVDYLIGMGRTESKFILILDIDKVLSAVDVVVLDEVVGAANVSEPETVDCEPDEIPQSVEGIVSKPRIEDKDREIPAIKPYTKVVLESPKAKPQAPDLSNQVSDTSQVRIDKSPKPEKLAKEPSQDKRDGKEAKSSEKQSARVETNATKGDLTLKKTGEKTTKSVEREHGVQDSSPEKAKEKKESKSEPDKTK